MTDERIALSIAMQAEEIQRKEFNSAQCERLGCVPWRGSGGPVGICIYCGRDLRLIWHGQRQTHGTQGMQKPQNLCALRKGKHEQS